jgi:hypothetical protein
VSVGVVGGVSLQNSRSHRSRRKGLLLLGELSSAVSRSLTVASRSALVILFIVGIALIMAGLVWLVDTAKSHHARRTRVPPLHT